MFVFLTCVLKVSISDKKKMMSKFKFGFSNISSLHETQ